MCKQTSAFRFVLTFENSMFKQLIRKTVKNLRESVLHLKCKSRSLIGLKHAKANFRHLFRNVVYYMQRLMEVYEEVVLNKKCRSRGLEVVEGAGLVGTVPRRAACRFRRRGPARSVVLSTLGTRSAVTSPAAPAQGPPAPYYCTSFGTL